MHVLAPIGKLVLLSIACFQDEDNKINAIKEIETISTTEYNDNLTKLSFDTINDLILHEKEITSVYLFATLSKIFYMKNNIELASIYDKEYTKIEHSELKNKKNIEALKWFQGFMSAIFLVSIANTVQEIKPNSFPEHIQHAIDYIEKHNYKVEVYNVS